MAVLGSILFNRTLKQFLECKDIASKKGKGLSEKIKKASKDSLDKILETLPYAQSPHREVLMAICVEAAKGKSDEMLLDSLENDATVIRRVTAEVLSKSSNVSPSKLFNRLHETEVSKSEIIEILGFQKETLKAEHIINNVLKLDSQHAKQLLSLAEGLESPLDVDSIAIDPPNIKNADVKIMLLRYFSNLDQPEVAAIIGKFLSDENKTIAYEALRALNRMEVKIDASVVLPFVDTMTDNERQMAFEIISKNADSDLVPKLAPWTSGKSDELRETLIKIIIKYITQESLEKFLQRLDQQDWYGKEQAIKCMQKFGTNQLWGAAQGLIEHKHEFTRNTAQQFAAQHVDPADLLKAGETAIHENWQVREKAIATLGSTGKRESLAALQQAVEQWPDSAVAVLKAVTQLGYSKGLEIGFMCLKMPEALVQREALHTIANLATKDHSEKVRETVLKMVPQLQATVRDTAEEVINKLTKDFKLPELNINREELFETRLIKIDQAQAEEKVRAAEAPVDATEVVKFQNIEELKDGDFWMERYRIKGEIGRGAMGRVMLAEDEMVGEPLILKFMHPELTADGASRERFLREVKYSRKVGHHNVIRIHDLLMKDNLCAISMEYFESRGIDEVLEEIKRYEAKPALEILYQVSEGMIAAHLQEVIHRDLKPSNILIDDSGFVKVVDFGIASASASSDSTLTKTGSIIGTPAYLSPERAKGIEAHYRCDIYALGIIAYRMLTGELPYKGEPMAILFQHLEGNATPVHEVNKSISPHVSLLVQKMMAVEAEDRIQTMEDVSLAIKKALKKL
jgi:tRNA A-37 threonylcarbamoyl transferase component Bud32/HEAT repeat protein